MSISLSETHRKQEVTSNNNGLIDLLTGLLLVGIAMAMAFWGFTEDISLLYGLGIALMTVAVAYSAIKFIREIRNFIWENQARRRSKLPQLRN